ncbi:PIR protein [Plasmodium yoelii]|uniref:PIR protein n=2 Tax=Plasmodium yoelii TaxID=5861 RepID=A0AAE9WL53_PLAYO|nr:PIR protein [Plasmodium yoelii]WBY54399.1 PIR protein [Plasmodium yoelii yoelii]VTZ71418.1 PIR protein [Plasmodium yoelii]|eukprot:XP_022810744.1 PIR protein [Plasmodium yoelii]
MDKQVCESFLSVWEDFPDTLTETNEYHEFKDGNFLNSYCFKDKCDHDHPLDKINAGCLFLFNKFFGSSGVFKDNAKNYINAVEYIIIWLSHMLNLKDKKGNILKNFYEIYIKNQDKYKNTIDGVDGCNYDDLIYKKNDLMNITNEKLSKFYAPFKSLCNMYNAFNETKPNCDKCLNYADEFVKKYNELNGDSSITNDSSRNKLLCTLSNDYDDFKKKHSDVKCSNLSFQAIEKPKNCVENSKQNPEQPLQRLEQISQDVSSSSSIGNKLFTVLSIFGAIAFFLGISYKYSLFGFRKRFQKQKLREKLKNIKKRVNH